MANTTKSTSKLKILYAEGDSEVLATQSLTIEKAGHQVTLGRAHLIDLEAGHQVTQAEGRQQVQDLLKREPFDLVILGATLSKNDRHHLAYMVKKAKSGARLLVTHTDGEGHPAVDATLETGRSMNALLEKIASMYPQAVGAASGR